MGQNQGKGNYSQLGFDPDSPDGADLAPPPDTLRSKATQQLNNIKTHAEQAVLRAKVLTGAELDLDNVTEPKASEDMTFVFHNGDGDCEERVVHEDNSQIRNIKNEPKWRIYKVINNRNVLVGQRLDFLPLVDINRLQFNSSTPILIPGTIVEFGAHDKELEWAIINKDEAILWKNGRILKVSYSGVPNCRLVKNIYKINSENVPSPTEAIVRATSENYNSVQFSNSECWAAWCCYGIDEFQAVSSPDTWILEWTDINIKEEFSSLDQLIVTRRTREAKGLEKLQEHFGVKQNLRGLVQCIQ